MADVPVWVAGRSATRPPGPKAQAVVWRAAGQLIADSAAQTHLGCMRMPPSMRIDSAFM